MVVKIKGTIRWNALVTWLLWYTAGGQVLLRVPLLEIPFGAVEYARIQRISIQGLEDSSSDVDITVVTATRALRRYSRYQRATPRKRTSLTLTHHVYDRGSYWQSIISNDDWLVAIGSIVKWLTTVNGSPQPFMTILSLNVPYYPRKQPEKTWKFSYGGPSWQINTTHIVPIVVLRPTRTPIKSMIENFKTRF